MKFKKSYAVLAFFLVASTLYAHTALSGSVACGSGVVSTKPMPVSGKNFSSYCQPCIAALRTYGRVPVIETVTAAYGVLNKSHPETHFLYGEIGFPDGGRFRPHRTHREGLSVDLMVPLQQGKIMQTGPFNRYGYDVEFDAKGNGDQGSIDFAALGALIAALDSEAKKRGGKIRRIYFAPDLQPELKAASTAALNSITFNKKQAWVRHDDHIHVDFEFSCSAS